MADYWTGNFYLTESQMQTNATYIYEHLKDEWTLNAISGLLGNTETESTHNPGIWQNLKENVGPGYGLTQWTPYTKYTNWCQQEGLVPSAMDSALARLRLESQSGGLQWVTHSKYPLTFAEYIKSTESPYYLGMTFLNNYEMPEVINQPNRGTQAEKWYKYLSGETPPPPGPGEGGDDRNQYTKGRSFIIPILAYNLIKRRF